jgi:STE24 endopeptidase
MSETMAARMKLPLALAATVVVAEAAVLLLLPRAGVVAPAEVDVAAYFSPAQRERAEAFRGPQPWLYALRLACELAVLAWFVRPGSAIHRVRPLVAGALLSLAVTAAALPVAAVSRQRGIDVGLVTRSWPGWAWDVVLDGLIGAAFAGVGAAFAMWLVRRSPQRWWLPAAGLVVAFAVALTTLQPVVLDPLFNRFTPLPAGPVRSDVLALAERSGVDVGEVFVIDASRRTTAANAYVAGLGTTKRVVLYDTLVEDFPRAEVRQVVAHELGHVHHRDVSKGLLWVAVVAPVAMFAAAQLTRRLGGTLPALALSVAVLVPLVTAISNQLSRPVEARADTYALRLTGEPEPYIAFERRIALRNVSHPEPPGLATFLLATHPPVLERIGLGVAFSRSRAARGCPRGRATWSSCPPWRR